MPRVLITGANRGIGLEFARQYARDGWDVLACCRSTSSDLEGMEGVEVHHLDVTDHAAVESLAASLSGLPIDVLINNAGVNGQTSSSDRSFANQAFGNTDYENWRETLEINLIAPMKLAECFVDSVAASRQKKIVTLSSEFGSISRNDMGGFYRYRSSKAGVNAVMRSMAVDLEKLGILAVALHPGWVRTDLGGDNADIDVQTSVSGMRSVIASLTREQVGDVIDYDGRVVPY